MSRILQETLATYTAELNMHKFDLTNILHASRLSPELTKRVENYDGFMIIFDKFDPENGFILRGNNLDAMMLRWREHINQKKGSSYVVPISMERL